MPDPVLSARNVTKTFYAEDIVTRVLEGVSLALRAGDFVALMGPSGSGKSTLLHVLGTLLRPTSGEIEIVGRALDTLDDRELTRFRNRHIGFVFQFHHLLPDFTAVENVMYPSFPIYGRAIPATQKRARYLLERVGLAKRTQYRATRLSGGEKQRVAIARALMNTPDLILADEPTGNVDRETSATIMKLLREVADDEDIAFFISTHDAEIADACDHILRIEDGRIAP